MKIVIPNHKAFSWNKLYEQKHWAKRKQVADEIHMLVWAYIKKAKIDKQFKKPVEIKITAYYKDKRRRDVDNICSKLYIDGLKKAGVLIDDDYRYVKKISKLIEINAKSDKVIIEALESN